MKKYDFLKNVNTKVSPGDDFFSYVNSNWIKKYPMPSEQSTWAIFNVVHDSIQYSLKDMLDGLLKGKITEKNLKKLRDFYKSGMDEATLNKHGAKPLDGKFKNIESVKNSDDVINILADFHTSGVDALWSSFVEPDDKNSKKNILRIMQSGLGLPDREYYLAADKKSKNVRDKYLKSIVSLSKSYGENRKMSEADSKIIFNIEKRLAGASMTGVELRDPDAQYNKMSLNKLVSTTSNINWKNYFKQINVKEKYLKELIVNQPKFIKEINNLFKEISIYEWKQYLKWHLMTDSTPYLSEKLAKERFKFEGTVLSGQKKIKPRWKRVLKEIDFGLPDVIGKLYVDKFFPPEAKRRMNVMIDDIMAAYKARIQKLDWMSSATKKKALDKLSRIDRKIGYPNQWEKYNNLEITNKSFIENHWNSYKFALDKMMRKLEKPVNRKEWFMSTPTVNAYYWPNLNEIVFPAGILQPPFFDMEATDAWNYGGTGSVIGHELTHGFDDKGSQFDGFGNLKQWWGKNDRARFKKKAKKLSNQYGACEVLPGIKCNGDLTLGENIADLGGLTIAYDALQKRMAKTGKRENSNGLTPEQQFFIAWGKEWAGSVREEEQRRRLITDPHSPYRLRVNMVVNNIDEFYQAFNVKPADKLYRKPNDRVKIW